MKLAWIAGLLIACADPSSAPAPSTPAPSTPAPSTPAPSTPAPSAPTPSAPTPSAPAPSAPAEPIAAPPAAPVGPLALRAVAQSGRKLYLLLPGAAGTATGEAHRLDDMLSWHALARPPALPAERVRIVGREGECDGTLGTPVQLVWVGAVSEDEERSAAAPVRGCDAIRTAVLAVLDPSWPRAERGEGPLAARALAAARAAAEANPSYVWGPDRTITIGAAAFALAYQRSCEEQDCDQTTMDFPSRGVLARAGATGEPEVLLSRPPHLPWQEAYDAYFDFVAIADLDGDGTPELVESLGCNAGALTRVLRVSPERRAGDVAWRATYSEPGSIRPRIGS